MTSIATYAQITQEYENFKQSYTVAGTALANVITQGTTLYNDAALATAFPTSINTYKTYLVDLQSAINTFIAGLPVEPPLNG